MHPPLNKPAHEMDSDDYSAHEPGSLLGNLAVRVAGRQRERLYRLFLEAGNVRAEDRILDLGVTSDERHATNNYLERWYPHKQQIVAAGLSEQSYLPERYPGIRYVKIAPETRLPFPDQAFELVHASAVIEHAGSREQQQSFLRELWRVCRRAVFVTTPNRWFPVEVHTAIPLLHWLPPRLFRRCLKAVNLAAWAEESQLNLLSRGDLMKLAEAAGLDNARVQGVRLFGCTSNLALIAQRIPGARV